MTREEIDAKLAQWRQGERAAEERQRNEHEGKVIKIQTVADYIETQQYENDRRAFRQVSSCRTGYANIDAIQRGLNPGLYVLGAVPALGKTTFLNQMGDQIAAKEKDVVFFTLEQSRLELVSKSLARMTYWKVLHDEEQRDALEDNARTALQIRKNDGTNVDDVAAEYANTIGKYKYIVPLDYSSTVNDITAALAAMIRDKPAKQRPLVIVDYLQALAPPVNGMQIRDAVNYNIEALKTFQRENDLILWVVSSFNRASYYAPATMEALKESGGIEFCADYVAAMQLAEINRQASKESVDTLRDTAQSAKKMIPRKVDYVCLKNRFGNDYTVSFFYDSAYDCFIPNLSEIDDRVGETTERDTGTLLKALEAVENPKRNKKKH